MLDCPCIHVSLLPGADPAFFRWVEIGAEEEGVPTRQVPGEASDLAALAYQAAQSSRFNIGVGISAEAVALHEQHMPAGQPVLVFRFSQAARSNASRLCRLMGANAARMVVHRPLHIDIDFPPPAVDHQPPLVVPQPITTEALPSAASDIDPVQLAKIIALVVQKLQQRGM
jgi:hypothetical protein